MSHQEEKNQSAKDRQQQQNKQNQQNQQNKQQQAGNRVQGQQGNLRDGNAHLRAGEGEQSSQRWNSEKEQNGQSGYDRNSQDR